MFLFVLFFALVTSGALPAHNLQGIARQTWTSSLS